VLGPAGGKATKRANGCSRARKVVPRRSVRPFNPSEIHSEVEIKKRRVFDKLIERRHGTSNNPPKPMKGESDTKEPNEADGDADTEPAGEIPDIEDILDSTGKVLNQHPMWEKLINAEIILQQGDKLQRGKVKRRSIDDNGKTIGTYSDNPITTPIIYEVEFPDGELKEYAANILAENMLSHVDHEGHNIMLMRDIIDYKRDEAIAVPTEDKYLTTRSGQRRLRKTTQGWSFLVNWKDGTESWVKLAELKDSYPIELAEFASLSAVKARVRKKTRKCGIEVPASLVRAKELGCNTLDVGWHSWVNPNIYCPYASFLFCSFLFFSVLLSSVLLSSVLLSSVLF
jgi:hypothetical protein